MPAATVIAEPPASGFFKNIKLSGRVSLLTSQSTKPITYRDLKTTGTDDATPQSGSGGSGSGSERTTAANLSYFSASTAVNWNSAHETSFHFTHSLSSLEDRSIQTPFGAKFAMPGDIVGVRQAYYFTSEYSASLSGGYTDITEYRDPSLGVNYTSLETSGFAPRWGLSASVPTTPGSYKNGLITKAMARVGFSYNSIRWRTFGSLSFNQGFYKDLEVLKNSRGMSASSAARSPGGPPAGTRPTFEQIDVLLSEAELSRTATTAGVFYHATSRIKLSSSIGLAKVDTIKGNELWLTALKPLGLQYRLGPLEASANVLYYSDITKYKSPVMPENLNVGLNIAYNFGERPTRR